MTSLEEQGECLTGLNLKKCNKTPLALTFNNISYTVPLKRGKETKTLFHDVCGRFESGRLTAILGPSGAGKSSLVKVLAGFRTRGVTGGIYVNEQRRDIDEFKWQSSCISQECEMLLNLTVQETLAVAANLKLSSKVPKAQKDTIITEIAEILGLTKSMETRVAKISGGEMKRLSIGVELVTNPPIMFFDEPTSGLDSVSSALVVSHMRDLASGGRTIICVIHQPSSKIFDMFDDVLVMSEGRSLYCGPISEMVSTFQSAGFSCPQYYNRADFALEVATNEITGDRESLINQAVKKFNSDIKISKLRKAQEESEKSENNRFFNNNIVNKIYRLDTVQNKEKKRHSISEWTQFKILFNRSSTCIYRDLHLSQMKIAGHIVVGLILGLIYFQIGNEASKITTNSAFLFFMILFIYFGNGMPAVVTFPVESPIFIREMQNNWYSLKAYYFSKLLADLPLQMFCPTIFFLIAYFMTEQPPEVCRVLMAGIVCFCFALIANLLGLITGVLFKLQLGMFCLPAFTIPLLVFSGFFIRFEEVPGYLQIFSYLSCFSYGFEAIMLSIYSFGRGNLHCSEPFCFFKNPSKYLEEADMHNGNYYKDIGCLILWILTLQILLYVLLKRKVWKSRQ